MLYVIVRVIFVRLTVNVHDSDDECSLIKWIRDCGVTPVALFEMSSYSRQITGWVGWAPTVDR